MKFYLLAVLLVALSAIFAAPAAVDDELEEPEEDELEEPETEEDEDATGQRRISCDLLSLKGFADYSSCAVNCLSMGKVGARCENGVCVCRTTTFKELWDTYLG